MTQLDPDALVAEMTGWRRDLHAHPEFGFAEARMMMRNGSGEELVEARKRQRGLAPSEFDKDQGM